MSMQDEQLKNRELYLRKLIHHQDSDEIKIIIGMRRTGKSCLMKLMADHLMDTGISKEQVIQINFESIRFQDVRNTSLMELIRNKAPEASGKKMYIFFDQIQHTDDWQEGINYLKAHYNCDIYIATSNAVLLKSESIGRLDVPYKLIKVLPLSFREFLYFYGYHVEYRVTRENILTKKIFDSDGFSHTPEELFELYLRFGGMPAISNIGMYAPRAMPILEGIYSALVLRELLEREPNRGGSEINDISLLRNIINELCTKLGQNISIRSMGRRFIEEYMDDEEYALLPEMKDVQSYTGSILETYFFEHLKRYDILSGDYQRTNGKYYITDLGLRTLLVGNDDPDRNHMLENIIFLELLRCGYKVSNGIIRDREVDFVADREGSSRKYIQVTESLDTEELRERCITPLEMIPGQGEKILISLAAREPENIGNIHVLPLLDFLMEDYDILHENSEFY